MTGFEWLLKLIGPTNTIGKWLIKRKAEKDYRLFHMVKALGIDSGSKDFTSLYFQALKKWGEQVPADLFDLFRLEAVQEAFQGEFYGKGIKDAVTLQLNVQIHLQKKFSPYRLSIESDAERFRQLLQKEVQVSQTPVERLQQVQDEKIAVKVDATYSEVTEIKNIAFQNQEILRKSANDSTYIINEIADLKQQLLKGSLSEDAKLRTQDFDEDIEAIINLIKTKKNRAAIEQLNDFKQRKWERATPAQRYRIQANLGLSHFELGESQQASEYFIDLPNYLQTAESFGLAALGNAIIGDCPASELNTQKAFAIDPHSSHGWTAWIQCLPEDTPPREIIDKLGPELLTDEMIGIGVVSYIKSLFPEDMPMALEILKGLEGSLEEGTTGYYEIIELRSVLITSMALDPTSSVSPKIISEQDVVKLTEAIKGFSDVWEFYKQGDLRLTKWHVLANRGSVHRHLGEYENARRDYYASLHESKQFFTYRQLIQLKTELGEPCFELMDEMERELEMDTAQKDMVYLAKADKLWAAQKHHELLQLLSAGRAFTDPEAVKWLNGIKIRSLYAVDQSLAAFQLAESEAILYPNDPYTNFLAGAMAFKVKKMDVAKHYTLKGADVLKGEQTEEFIDEFTALLFEFKEFDRVITLLNGKPHSASIPKINFRLLSSLCQTGRNREAYNLAEDMWDPEHPDPMVAEVRIEKYQSDNQMASAYELSIFMTDHLKAPLFYMKAISALFHLNRDEQVSALLNTMPGNFENNVTVLVILAAAIKDAGNSYISTGLQQGYRYRNDRLDLPDINIHTYFVDFYGKLLSMGYEEPVLATIVNDCWVQLRSAQGAEQLEFIVENNPQLANSIEPSSEIGRILHGKSIGDEVVINEQAYKISAINCKYNFAYLESRNTY